MFYGFLTLILNIFTLEFFLSDFSNTPLLKYPLFKKVKISRNYSFNRVPTDPGKPGKYGILGKTEGKPGNTP